MDMMTKMMDQMQSAVAQTTNRAPAQQTKKSDDRDFGKMVRQKQKEVRKDKAEEPGQKPEAKGKADEPANTDAPQQDAKPVEEVTDAQYAMAAALLYEMQPNFNTVELKLAVEAPVEQAAVEAVVEAPVEQVAAEVLPELNPEQGNQELPQQLRPVREEVKFEAPVEVRREAVVETEAPVEHVSRAAHTEQVEVRQEEETEEIAPELVEQESAPVFERVEAAPVKVAEHYEPVPLEAEDGIDQLNARIQNFIVNDNGSETVELTLTPASLGTVKVEIVHAADGALHVHLTANTERAVNLLTRGTENLQNLLAADNRPNVTVTVRGGQDSQQQLLNANADGSSQQHQNGQEQQRRRQREHSEDFMHQLRLGLVDNEG